MSFVNVVMHIRLSQKIFESIYILIQFLFGFVWVPRGLLNGGDGREGVNKCLIPRTDGISVHVPNNEVNFYTETKLI